MRVAAVLLLAFGLTAAAAGQQGLGVESSALMGEPLRAPLSGEELEQATLEVSRLLRCPVCQGLSVADSPTELALAMREEVRSLLAAGYTEEQIFNYFEQVYGEFVRLQPKPEGFNLLVWIAPVLALLAGAALVILRVRGAGKRRGDQPLDDEELEAYRERIRREVET